MKKEQKNNEKTFYAFLIVAICHYITAIMWALGKDKGMAGMYICLGSAFLCLAISYRNKEKEKNEDDDKKE